MKKILLLFTIAFSINVPAQWITLNSGTTNFLPSIHFPQQDTGYVVAQPTLRKTTDGGVNWNNITVPISPQVVYFLTTKTGFVAGANIRKTTDGGATWVNNFPFSIASIQSMHFPSSTTGYAIGLSNNTDTILIFKTVNAGGSWSLISKFYSPLSPATTIFFTDVNTGYFGKWKGTIYKTTNGGTSWIQVYNNSGAFSIYGMHFPAQDTGYAVGDIGGAIIKTVNGGINWTQQTNTNTNPLYSVFFVDTKRGFACGGNSMNSGDIIETIDGGINWALSASNVETFFSIYFPSSNTGYACGTNGIILKYNAAVGTWGPIVNDQFSIYPNPGNGIFNLSSAHPQKESQIVIYNSTGEKIYSDIISSANLLINLCSQPKGVYFIKLQNGDEVFTDKIIIQ